MLTACWARLCLVLFQPFQGGGRLVCLADGIKAPKEGRKMPAVKLLEHLAIHDSAQVWRLFRSSMRTMKPAKPPSQRVVATTLRETLEDFLAADALPHRLRMILHRYREPRNASRIDDSGSEIAA